MTAPIDPTIPDDRGVLLPELDSRRALEDVLHAYRRSQLLITATEIGVFDGLTPEPQSSGDLARRCGVDPARFQALVEALVAMGLLHQDAAGYTAGPLAAAHLVPDAPSPLRNWVRAEAGALRGFTRLTAALAPQEPEVPADDDGRTDGPDLPRAHQRSLADIAHANAASVAAAVEALVPGGRGRLLDAGGGHGTYSIDLARRMPGWSAVVVDRPDTVKVAAEAAAEAGVADRVATRAADLLTDPLGSGFDLAFLFMVHPDKNDDQALQLFAGVWEALAPGGWLLIRSFYWRDPLEEALFNLKHYLHQEGGAALTLAATEKLLATAGFTEIHLLEEAATEPRSLLAARRPKES